MNIKKFDGANMDIDLTSEDKTSWKQMKCPWNEAEGVNTHKCAIKNVSICEYFCGIEYLDNVICCYPGENTSIDNKLKMNKIPEIIKQVGFDFSWQEEKVWQLDLPVEDISITELEWHFEIPFWDHYSLKPIDVLNDPKKYQAEYDRTMKADLLHPLDIMFWKNRWLLLDGLHRLLKAKILDQTSVKVRKVSKSMIPKISK